MNYWPSAYIGEFHAGYKVFYERLGNVEVKHLLRAFPLDALVSYHIYILESQEREYVKSHRALILPRVPALLFFLPHFSAADPSSPTVASSRRRQLKLRGYSLPFINVQDSEGLGMKHAYGPGIDFLKSLTKIDEANYPEMVHQIFFINTPSVFNVLYKLVQPFIPQTTIDKVRLSKDELLSLMPTKYVPTQLGGSANINIRTGGEIYDKDIFPAGVRQTVEAGKTFELEIVIEQPGSTLHVHFATESNDIGFSLLFKAKKSQEARPLVPAKRYDSHLIASHVEIPIQEPGIYIAIWDNAFSKWTSKSLFYHLGEITPVQQAQALDEALRTDPLLWNSNGFLAPKPAK